MGDRQIFLKNCRASSFNKDLSNEPNFGRIPLAGQYLQIQNQNIKIFKAQILENIRNTSKLLIMKVA
jgi:hypothetical protein